jgi:nucleotide-binding universal stress UspA family protein
MDRMQSTELPETGMPDQESAAMPSTCRNIVIGTSVTGASDEVVTNGVWVARACGARIHLVHAFQSPLAYAGGTPYGTPLFIPEVVEERRASRQRLLAAQAERLGIRPEEEAGRTVAEGAPYAVLAETAAETGADLLVTGAAEGWERLKRFLGSTADRVVRKAGCPVLVTRGRLRVPPRRVLVGVDLSSISGAALEQGLELIGAMGGDLGGGVEVRVVQVVEVEPLVLELAAEPATLTRLDPAAVQNLGHFVANHCPEPDWRVKPLLRSGPSAAAEIIALASEMEADLIVIGSHGRSGLPRFLLGSVAERVLRNASQSVLVVPGAGTGP